MLYKETFQKNVSDATSFKHIHCTKSSHNLACIWLKSFIAADFAACMCMRHAPILLFACACDYFAVAYAYFAVCMCMRCACDIRLKLTIENFSVSWNRTHREAMRLLTALLMRQLILITIRRSSLSLSLTHTHTHALSLSTALLMRQLILTTIRRSSLSLTHTLSLVSFSFLIALLPRRLILTTIYRALALPSSSERRALSQTIAWGLNLLMQEALSY